MESKFSFFHHFYGVAGQIISFTFIDRKKELKIDLTPDGSEKKKKKKLPPRPEDYDYYWYQDESGTWRNEYDDYGNSGHGNLRLYITK